MKRVLLTVVVLALGVIPAPAASAAATWYVSAAAGPGGNGTSTAPFNSLATVELASGPGSRLVVDEIGNTQTFIGGPDSDCEGLFFDVSGSSTMIARVDGNTCAHGIGGTSCNGMELITGLDNATADVRVSNSTFEDNPGDMIEAGTLGNGSKMFLELDHVTVRNTTIRGGNNGAIPFNIGECLLAGNSAADGVFSLRVRNSEFTGCNNGIMVASNVALGNGSARRAASPSTSPTARSTTTSSTTCGCRTRRRSAI